MNFQLKIMVIAFGVALLLLLARLIRRGRIRPEYSLFWLIGLGGATAMVTLDRAVFALCRALGPDVNPFGLLSMGATLFLAATCLHLTMRVSLLKDQSCLLDQKAAHLEAALKDLQSRAGQPAP